MEDTLEELGCGQAGGVAASAWGAVLSIVPGRWTLSILPAPGRVSRAVQAGSSQPGEGVDLPGPGSTSSASLAGGSQSLCRWLQPVFGPASVDQMCARRRGGGDGGAWAPSPLSSDLLGLS